MATEDEVARLIRRLEEVVVDVEVTERTLQKVRQKMLNALDGPRPNSRGSKRLMSIPRIAVSVLCAAAVLSAILLLAWLGGDNSVAWADVQQRVKQMRSVSMIETTKVQGVADKNVPSTVAADGRIRIERDDNRYTISDPSQSKSIVVDKSKKTAMIVHGNSPHGPANVYDYLRNMHKGSVKKLPERKIDGKKAVGFAVTVQHGKFPAVDVNVWVDPKTDLPVQMESSSKAPDGSVVVTVIHDFHFEEQIDETLFSFDVPKGYEIEEHGLAQTPPTPEKIDDIASSAEVKKSLETKILMVSLTRVVKLLEADKIQQELDLSQEQMKKVVALKRKSDAKDDALKGDRQRDEKLRAELEALLLPNQTERLNQIILQSEWSTLLFVSKPLQQMLGLTRRQQHDHLRVREDFTKQVIQLLSSGLEATKTRAKKRVFIQQFRKKTLDILSQEQRQLLKSMKGEEFDAASIGH